MGPPLSRLASRLAKLEKTATCPGCRGAVVFAWGAPADAPPRACPRCGRPLQVVVFTWRHAPE